MDTRYRIYGCTGRIYFLVGMSSSVHPLSEGHRLALEARADRVEKLQTNFANLWPDGIELTIEIGCGHGHYLTAYAQQYPCEVCLGVDLVTRRIEKACAKRDKRQLSQLHFLKADAWECLDALPANVFLKRIFVLFPDPWPKSRHEKNRLLQHSLLDALSRKALPEARLHFRTDHEPLFTWASEQLATHSAWEPDPELEWPMEAPSYFQDLLGSYQSVTARFIPSTG